MVKSISIRKQAPRWSKGNLEMFLIWNTYQHTKKKKNPFKKQTAQVIQGAGHHVYADRAANFNRVLAKLSASVDSCIEGFKGALN